MARIREIQDLEWADWADRPPWAAAVVKGYSAQQRAGLAYERRFGLHLARCRFPDDALLLDGPWIRFRDRNGEGYAQPDFILASPRGAILFECKLKENTKAWIQLFRLYTPLVEFILRRELTRNSPASRPGPPKPRLQRVQVCKHLRPLPPGVERMTTIHRAKDLTDECVWNWTGRGTAVARQRPEASS